MKYAFKTLAMNNRSTKGGNIEWFPPVNDEPGIWMNQSPSICDKYYLCSKNNLIFWLDEAIYIAEFKENYEEDNGDVIVNDSRLVKKINSWNEETKKKFADSCFQSIKLDHYPNGKDQKIDFENLKIAYEIQNIIVISKLTDKINPKYFQEQKDMILNIIMDEVLSFCKDNEIA